MYVSETEDFSFLGMTTPILVCWRIEDFSFFDLTSPPLIVAGAKNDGTDAPPFFPLPLMIDQEPDADVLRSTMSRNGEIDRGRYFRRMRAPSADASRYRSTSS